MEFEGRKKINTDLNIAPLIDVVFQLLLFFMLTANFITQPGIKLALPAAVSAQPQQEEDLVVFITKDNELYLNQAEVSLEDLPGRLKSGMITAKKKTVVIKADERINFGFAVKVMDIAKQAEAQGLVISTTKEEDAK
ncbi:MAG: biopolymer transporter ExbD [Candidatus Omnitrophota bacterium]|jgi:biopolymer transport protein ExbD